MNTNLKLKFLILHEWINGVDECQIEWRLNKSGLEIYSGEKKEQDRVGERMILIGLAKKGNLYIDNVFEEYKINEKYDRISKSTT